ncbi:MAG TPA: DinB family protein [Candidatus Koribacter sp.]
MKRAFILIAVCFAAIACAQQQPPKPVTMKELLLQELHETHDQKDWFVSAKEATAGLTPEQSAWTDGKGNHSVGQLVYHLAFWNQDALARLKGSSQSFNGNNDDTFNKYDSKDWDATVKKFNDVMNEIEKFVENADEAHLAKMAPLVAHVCNHNAYHIGEIVMVRKEQGAWNPDNGVK